MARILVAGGSGFIGANLCGTLLEKGHDVVCLDNFASSDRSNISHLERHPRFSLLVGDVRSPIRVDADEVYNLACPASPPKYQADPVFTMETSVLGSINILELARRTGARVLLASTSEIYGEPLLTPQPETYRGNVNCWGPRACYDEGKRCAEALFFDYHHKYGVDVRVARIFNTYGPRMSPGDGRVVSNLVVQALTGRPMTIYGDGSQTRSLCYVDDLVRGLCRLMERPALAGPVNLGNPDECSVLAIAELVIELVGRPSAISFAPLPTDDPTHRCPDISRARDHLAWEPTVALVDGMKRTIAYFDDLLSGARLAGAAISEAAE